MKKQLPHNQITYLESDLNYTIIHYDDGSQETHGYTLKVFEKKFKNTDSFSRIHRSYLVNLNHISHKYASKVLMKSGIVLPVSRRRR